MKARMSGGTWESNEGIILWDQGPWKWSQELSEFELVELEFYT